MKIQDLILFVLTNTKSLGPTPTKKLNKLCFLLEWNYIFEKCKNLTNAKYVAINMGPVIDNYKSELEKMKKIGSLSLDENAPSNSVCYLANKKPSIAKGIDVDFLLKVLRKYENMNGGELEAFTHSLYSYNVTLENNENRMGGEIHKHLAYLEGVFSDEDDFEEEIT